MTSMIRDTRELHGVGVRELARRCGVSPSTVVGWERTEAHDGASVATLRRALAAMDRDVDVQVTEPSPPPLHGFSQRVQAELHRLYAMHLLRDPESVLDSAAERLPSLRRRVRGELPESWIDGWAELIGRRDVAGIVQVMLGLRPRDIEMRQVSPFAGILDEGERQLAADRAHA